MIGGFINQSELYDYWKSAVQAPYVFGSDFQMWKTSMFKERDVDGVRMFRDLITETSYYKDRITGFIQYGVTPFGFDAHGQKSHTTH